MYPYILLGNGFYIPTYLLVISLTYSLLLFWVFYRAQTLGKSTGVALDYALMIMIGGFFGGRLLHVFYEDWEYYRMFPAEIVKIWQGGFVYYGGMIGALIAAAIYSKWKRENFWAWADFYAPALALGYAMGRVGCFLNGCCFGELCDLPWAIEFNQPGLPSGARHPTQLYATFWELLVTLVLVVWLPKKFPRLFTRNGQIFGLWMFNHGVGRLIMEASRDDFRGPQIVGLSISQMISIVAIVVGLLLFTRRIRTPK